MTGATKLRRANRIREGAAYRAFTVCNYVFLALLSFTMLYPFWYCFIYSLNAGNDSLRGGLYFLPRVWTLKNYAGVLADQALIRGYMISISRTLVGMISTVFLCGVTAYAMSKKTLPGRKYVAFFFYFSTLFSGGMIPFFILIRQLGLYDTFWVYIVPSLFSFWNIVVMRTYIQSNISESIEESAMIDGAGYFFIYLRVILPLSMPVVAYMLLITGVGHWSEWFSGNFYVKSPKLRPAMTIIMKMVREAATASDILREGGAIKAEDIKTTNLSLQMAAVMLVTMPIIAIYPFLQRYFVSGVMVGGVKG